MAIMLKISFGNDMELSEMTHKIFNGYNQNEVTFVQKNTKKLGFFEKFFNYLVNFVFYRNISCF